MLGLSQEGAIMAEFNRNVFNQLIGGLPNRNKCFAWNKTKDNCVCDKYIFCPCDCDGNQFYIMR